METIVDSAAAGRMNIESKSNGNADTVSKMENSWGTVKHFHSGTIANNNSRWNSLKGGQFYFL